VPAQSCNTEHIAVLRLLGAVTTGDRSCTRRTRNLEIHISEPELSDSPQGRCTAKSRHCNTFVQLSSGALIRFRVGP
jgi:hypothetical protein